jgi:DNA-binding response OmpR family regulator
MALAPVRLQPEVRGGGRRVLFADDDPGMRAIVLMNLEAEGFDVTVVRDGDTALGEIERTLPDLIVLDVMMPRRSGFSVLEHIGHRGVSGPRIVVVSANEEQRHEQIARDKGADLYLKKPFEMRELLAAVDGLLKA